MDNKKLIIELRKICQTPETERKKEFFQGLAEQKLTEQNLADRRRFVMSHGEFLLGQLFYIQKRSWALSAVILLFITGICGRNPGYCPFALTPLLAAVILVETERSFRWKMAELEHAARFSLKSIVLARMFLVGIVDTVGLLVVICVVRPYFSYSLIRLFLYMMVPYLSASLAGSVYERKRRTDHDWGIIMICILSSAFFSAAPVICDWLYEEKLTIIWAAAFFILMSSLVSSISGWVRELEEPVWSL